MIVDKELVELVTARDAEAALLLKEYPHLLGNLVGMAVKLRTAGYPPIRCDVASEREQLFLDAHDCPAARTGFVISFIQDGPDPEIQFYRQTNIGREFDYLLAYWLIHIPEPLFETAFRIKGID